MCAAVCLRMASQHQWQCNCWSNAKLSIRSDPGAACKLHWYLTLRVISAISFMALSYSTLAASASAVSLSTTARSLSYKVM